jgi:hypothetical protein
MRYLLATLSLAAILLGPGAASAENRVFIIANHADGYGVDRCLATGAGCGTVIADSYCRSREFERALSYRKVERDDVAGSVTVSTSCPTGECPAFVAIECMR